jgi:hypothetical protein
MRMVHPYPDGRDDQHSERRQPYDPHQHRTLADRHSAAQIPKHGDQHHTKFNGQSAMPGGK